MDGIDLLVDHAGVPPAWSEKMLRSVITIASVTDLPGVDGAELAWGLHAPVRLDGEVLVHAQASLSEKRTSLGSVRGRLFRWLERGTRQEVGLFDEGTGRPVAVDVPPELVERTMRALTRTVLVWGEVRRNQQGDKLRVDMDDFEVIDVEGDPAPSSDEMLGFLGDWTKGVNSVDWVRAQRAD
jgi:hypothetical protein